MPEATLHHVPLLPYETDSERSTADTFAQFADIDDEEQPADEPAAEEQDQPEPEADEPEAEGDGQDEEVDEDEEIPEPSEEESAPPAPESVKLHLDGKEVEITLDELKRGYLRESEFTKKTQAIAEKAKSIDAERTKYSEALARLDEALTQMGPQEPDWSQFTDPAELANARLDWQDLQAERAAVAAERQRVRSEQEAESAREMENALRAEAAKLVEAIPEWKDEAKARAEKAQLAEYAKGMGFTDEDLSRVTDHRVIVLLRDAARYRELMTKGKEQIEEKKVAAKVLQPGSRSSAPRNSAQREYQQAKQRLKQTNSREAAVEVFKYFVSDD